jgi:hypothetical protein
VEDEEEKRKERRERRGAKQEFCAGGTTSVPGGTDVAGYHMTQQKT